MKDQINTQERALLILLTLPLLILTTHLTWAGELHDTGHRHHATPTPLTTAPLLDPTPQLGTLPQTTTK